MLGWDKLALKGKLQEAGISVPPLVSSTYSGWGVIKPQQGRGARGVYLIHTDDPGCAPWVAKANEYGETFIEQYIPGPQISTESIVYNGDVVFTGLTDPVFDDSLHPRFIEAGGYGPSVFEQSLRGEILKGPGLNFIQRIVNALGIYTGTIKGDVVLRQETFEPYLIEMAIGRLSGGFSCSHYLPLAYQVDFLGAAFAVATGQEPYSYVRYKRKPYPVVVAGGHVAAKTATINKERGKFRLAISTSHPAAEAKLSDMGVELP
jgi:biotin carboxylase